jgi:hypothetical protein
MPSIINASTSTGLIQTADTSGVLQLQSGGTTEFTVDSTGAYGQLQSATAQASTSGTSINFTGIPSWVKRITVIFNGTSGSGTSPFLIQIGAGSVTTTGYIGSGGFFGGANNTGTTTATNGFLTASNSQAGGTKYGSAYLVNITGNTWVFSSNLVDHNGQGFIFGNGGIALAGTLDRVRITTLNGTDTFDAGSINIMYEG